MKRGQPITVLRLTPPANIAVIGAGIVGTCCAVELVERGYKVTLFDRGLPGREGASRANAGQLIPSLIQPVAYPGILFDTFKLLFDPYSPLSIPIIRIPRLIPWIIRFLSASRQRQYLRGIESLAELNTHALEAVHNVYERTGLSSLIKSVGALYLYESDASMNKARTNWSIKGRYGFTHTFVRPDQIHELEPDLAPVFTGGVFEETVSHVSDPLKIVEGMFRYVLHRGVDFVQQETRIVKATPETIAVQTTPGTRMDFDGLVIAAGAWSRRLLNDIGDDAPLESERGYNITIPKPGVDIRHCLVFADRGFVATPLAPGLRIGGCVELAGLEAPPNPLRIQRIIEVARRLMPALDDSEGTTWMGHRPSLPDSVPIIRRSEVHDHVVYAFGHGHLGLTQAPITGRLVAEIFHGPEVRADT